MEFGARRSAKEFAGPEGGVLRGGRALGGEPQAAVLVKRGAATRMARSGRKRLAQLSKWDRLGRMSRGVVEGPPPPADVAPAAELVADLAVDPDRFEPAGPVQGLAGGVRLGHAAVGRTEALAGEQLEQAGVERLGDAAALGVRGDIDGD